VPVTHASAGFGTSVAEWVVGVMIDLSRDISRSVLAYRDGVPPLVRMGRELRGSRLGIIGYGHIGRHVGALALALSMRVSFSDPVAHGDDPAARRLPLDELLAESDFVLCLAPATAETDSLMNAARFARMKRGAFFINASRGDLVDDAALMRALDKPPRRLCAGCRPCARPDAFARAGASPARDRHAAHRRPDAGSGPNIRR
jgi:D-3-phosphoglycerate dehydrogenase